MTPDPTLKAAVERLQGLVDCAGHINDAGCKRYVTALTVDVRVILAAISRYDTPEWRDVEEAGTAWALCERNSLTEWRELGSKTDALEQATHRLFHALGSEPKT